MVLETFPLPVSHNIVSYCAYYLLFIIYYLLFIIYYSLSIATTRAQARQVVLLEKKDVRMSIINEALNGIKIIKLFVWEDALLGKISTARHEELKILFQVQLLNALIAVIWSLLSVFVTMVAFSLHVFVFKEQLSAAAAFTSLALFNMLKIPMHMLPWYVQTALSAYTSLVRIHEFLCIRDSDGLSSRLLKNGPTGGDSGSVHGSSLGISNGIGGHRYINSSKLMQPRSTAISLGNASFGWAVTDSEAETGDEIRSAGDGGGGSSINSVWDCCWKLAGGRLAAEKPSYQQLASSALGDGNESENESEIEIGLDNLSRGSQQALRSGVDKGEGGLGGDIEMGSFSSHSHSHSPSVGDKSTAFASSGATAVVRNITCDIPTGALVVVAGLTGCGKSTLLAGILGDCSLMVVSPKLGEGELSSNTGTGTMPDRLSQQLPVGASCTVDLSSVRAPIEPPLPHPLCSYPGQPNRKELLSV